MIVPALLTDHKEELQTMFDLCSEFTHYVQIDIMDGVFVPSKCVAQEELTQIKAPIRSEAHLMVTNPLAWIAPFKKLGSERIIFHVEISQDIHEVIDTIKKEELRPGLAVNPGTSLKDFEHFCAAIDTVLFLSVNPGFYGAPFIPYVLDKIRSFKNIHPQLRVGIDGGIKMDNLKTVVASGVDYVCVGSAILKASSPRQAYRKLSDVFQEVSGKRK